jgi:ABC-type sugar transport system substrate-binding protein
VTIELVDGDRPHLNRLGASLADYSTAGSLMAEQAANLVHASGADARVLLLTGDPYTDSHYLTARAFHNYLRERDIPWQVEDLAGAHAQVKQLEHELEKRLSAPDAPELICSVFAVGSEVVADALVSTGKAGQVMVIGNDLFPESALALRRGIFTNIVYKDPTSLAYRGAKTLGDYLLWGRTPTVPVQKGAVEMVFASNVDRYCELAGI